MGYKLLVALRRWMSLAVPFAALSVLTSLDACRETDPSDVVLAEAGIADVVVSPGAWETTACGVCALKACSFERDACAADPLCARNLDCLEGCPVDADDEPAAACVAACPAAGSAEGEVARAALEVCRATGAGARCSACYGGHREYTVPALTNVCEDPHWDAGPDATPGDESCKKCEAERCCDAKAACLDDPSCAALSDCQKAAPDLDGQDACNAQYDSSVAAFGAFITCLSTRCSAPSDCDLPVSPCLACVNDACGDAAALCDSDHDCYLLDACTRHCTDDACEDACFAKYPASLDLLLSAIDCGLAVCPSCFSGGQ